MTRYLHYDTLDDRREIFYLLHRLPPRRRMAFLDWCCAQARVLDSLLRPKMNASTRDKIPAAERDDAADRAFTLELFGDVWALACQYSLDMDAMTRALEEYVRGRPLTSVSSRSSSPSSSTSRSSSERSLHSSASARIPCRHNPD